MQRRSFSVGLLSCLACSGGGARPATLPRTDDDGPAPAPRIRPAPEPPIAPPAAAAAPTIPAAALAERAESLRARLGARGFTVLVEPPFVVAGDEPREAVERRAATTIRWSVEQLRREYFAADPAQIVEIYLFGDHDSYVRHARELFDDEPDTPYGYYTPTHEALIMNISAGGSRGAPANWPKTLARHPCETFY